MDILVYNPKSDNVRQVAVKGRDGKTFAKSVYRHMTRGYAAPTTNDVI